MRYADSLLSPGEVVVRRSRQHWLALLIEARSGVALIALAILLLVTVVVVSFPNEAVRNVISLVALVALVVGLVLFLVQYWQWWAQDYLITNRRILKVEGIINKRSADSSLEKINDAILEQDLFGRMFGYGDLDILTAADAAVDRYRMLDRAPDFKREMLSQKFQLEQGLGSPPPSPPIRTRPAPPGEAPGVARDARPPEPPEPPRPTAAPAPAPAPPPVRADEAAEITQLLVQLADLRDRGAITADEYEAKKRELLDRL